MLLCFGAAGLLLSVAWQQRQSIQLSSEIAQSVQRVFPGLEDESELDSPPLLGKYGEWIRERMTLDLRWGLDTPVPLAGLILPHPGASDVNAIAQVSLLTPHLNQAIVALDVRLVVDLSDAKVYSYWGEQEIASYPVAVGQPGWETPTGNFKVLRKQRNPIWRQPITGDLIPTGPDNPLGDRWIGFWSDEYHQIGFHGTNDEDLVGQPVSHGCLRMRNADIQALYEQIQVGTPILVRK
ncbi:ErfK/YbiS/YcfS/YnhG family [Coleofasciculus chthonoplastes PCC 7420]|uniref:ErfK/YbiS/YcfS/YnhG family n=2 Tax=Coleofasciculus chthonoplastes TaxID=64178 RepID=B4VHL5_9CYAN|nr:ErfK/YbiS/YcfS/YnhG family [Coleofasciculus chthonoplastes PCC 7420]